LILGCSLAILATAHGVCGPPPFSIAYRPRHVASGFASFCTETLCAPAFAAAVVEFSLLEAIGKRSASVVITLPLLRVVVGVRFEAFVISSAQIF